MTPLLPFVLLLTTLGTTIGYVAYVKSQRHQFYSDTFPLLPLGIFVWGDGLVLGPFWVVSSLLWWLLNLSFIWIIRYYLLFWIIRSCYECLYWLLHQSAGSHYAPPVGRSTAWLKHGEQHILYQVFHTCVVIVSLFLLMYTFA